MNIVRAGFVFVLVLAANVAGWADDDRPVIIIPGITGSELVNERTGELVWFKAPRSKDDDLRLPISADLAQNRDFLVPGDILRSIKFGIFARIDVYAGLVDAFKHKLGYHEEYWDSPTSKGYEKAVYVFPYDWRLDNVENARLLVRRVEELRQKLDKPGLKFDVVGHSMGGIIARYAAMYGDADLPAGKRSPAPTWAGARYFENIILVGTPNEGSPLSLNALVNGFAIGGININLPFVQNLTRFDVFTIPSAYQLLPAPGTLRAMDENFEPMTIDLFDPKDWTKYGWNSIDDSEFANQFGVSERRSAPIFFAAMLDRARRLHEALAAGSGKSRVAFHIVGAECNGSLDAIVMYHDKRDGKWRTLFKPAAFEKRGGERITSDELKQLMFAPGDGVVTKRSLETQTLTRRSGRTIVHAETNKYVCEEHNKLAANAEVQDHIIRILNPKASN